MKDVVCVTGGSGGIGRALLEQLVDRYQVKALFRAQTAATDAWAARGCTVILGDMSNEGALTELVKDAAFVFHCAALTQGRYQDLHAVNVEGTRTLGRLAAAHGCRRFVHVSSVSVYTAAATDGPVYTEDVPLSEHGEMAVYSRTKLQAEAALVDVARAQGLDYVILRPTCVYGPAVKSFTMVPIALVSKGLPAIVGAGRGLMDVVYVDDVARAMLLAAEIPAAGGQAFNIGHHSLTLNEFYAHYGRMLNRPVRHLPMGVVHGVHSVLRAMPAQMLAELRQGVKFLGKMADSVDRFPSDKAQTVLGYAPDTSLPVGMLKVALWARRQNLAPDPYLSVPTYGPGPVPFTPRCVVHPESEEDLAYVARIARHERVAVRAIGSLHSLSPVPATDGICVVLDRYNGLVRVDGQCVTAQAGMTLKDLNHALAERGLALPALGAITQQTVAGAVSTSTHGGSLEIGSISDQVESLRLVRTDGQVVEIDRTSHLFPAAAVSLGLLGIISTITFRCVPAFTLRSRSTVRTVAQALDEFDAIHRGHMSVDMLYFPATDQMEIFTIDRPAPGQAAEPEHDVDHFAVAATGWFHGRVARRLRAAAVKRLAGVLIGNPWLHRTLTARSIGTAYRSRTGRSDRVLAFGDGGTLGRSPLELQLEGMEVGVPYSNARAAIETLRRHFRETGKATLLPIHVRCSPASPLWLSPAYGRDVCWLEFWLYPHPDGLSKAQVHALLEPFGYRFHWGKQAHVDPAYLRRQYEHWDDFARLRDEWDPHRILLNGYLESFFPAGRPTAT